MFAYATVALVLCGLPGLRGYISGPLVPGALLRSRGACRGYLRRTLPRPRAAPTRGPVRVGIAGAAAVVGAGPSSGRGEYVSILRETVNRGVNVSLMARVYGNYKKRKLNIEHVVPRAVILATAPNASMDLDASCQEQACNDLFNMFLAVPRINRARRDYKLCSAPYTNDPNKRRPTILYGQLNSKKRKFSEHARDVWWSLGNGLFVNDRMARFVPRPEDRGLLGRAILHMADTYGCDAELVVEGGRETAVQWHRGMPPDAAELLHVVHVSHLVPHPHAILQEHISQSMRRQDAEGTGVHAGEGGAMHGTVVAEDSQRTSGGQS